MREAPPARPTAALAPRRLLVRPRLQPGESLPSWLARLAAANGRGAPDALTPLVVAGENARDAARLQAGNPACAATYQCLAALTCTDIAELAASTRHRFAPTLAPPGVALATLGLPDGVALPLLAPAVATRRLRPQAAGQFCPACLAEAAYHRLLWSATAVAACVRHRVLLAQGCPACGTATRIRDIATARCGACGADLTATPAVAVGVDRVGLLAQRVVQAWLLGEAAPDDAPLPALAANVGYHIVDGLRFVAQAAGEGWAFSHRAAALDRPLPRAGALSPAHSYLVHATAFKALLDWPQGWHAFLEAYQAHNADTRGAGSGTGIYGRLGPLYSTWIRRAWRHPAFGFLQDAFDRYLLDRHSQVHAVTWTGRCRENAAFAAQLPYLTVEQAARLLGASPDLISALLRAGRLTTYDAHHTRRKQQCRLVGRDEVLALRAEWHQLVTLAEAARLLGVAEDLVPDLVAVGLLGLAQPSADSHRRGTFTRQAVAACADRVLARVGGGPGPPATAWSLTRAATALATVGMNGAAILAWVAEGSLRAYHPGGDARRLGDLRFVPADIAACLARVRAARGWLTRAEAQRRLGVRSQTLKCWVGSGLLVPACAAHGAQYFARASVETFRADHVTSAQAAALLGVSKLTVRLWARLGRLHPVSGPGVDGVGSYLFARAAILAWRVERLAIGEARTLLGVSRATVDRWVTEGRLAPLTDMGGTKRWFARRDVLQLRETLRQASARPG